MLLLWAAVVLSCMLLTAEGISDSADGKRPNIVFLLVDDQDLNSLDYMPKLNTIMREGGMKFRNFFVSTSLCCPSRATIMRGQYCHNTKVYDNGETSNDTYSSGGFTKYLELENETIGTVLKEAGYETFFIGKYFNEYTGAQASHVPVGWDHWYVMVIKTYEEYFGPHFSMQGELLCTPQDTYQTDFISTLSQNLLKNRDKSKPFFMYLAPYAPHAPADPAPRHTDLFKDEIVPRTLSFNPNDTIQQQKPSWIKHLPLLDATEISSLDELYRNRLRAMQAVDEMLENITLLLQEEGIEDNTYIFYMSDNGEHLGDFRMPAGKRQVYDTDIHVPFLVRGPGIKGGTTVTEMGMSVDLLPTWVELARAKLPTSYEADGKSITPLLFRSTQRQSKVNEFRSVAFIELYGGSSSFSRNYRKIPGYEGNRFWNNSYQAVRVINASDWAEDANWLYAEWCTGEKEFYNVTEDPYEIHNIIDQVNTTLLTQLSTLKRVFATCSGKSCYEIDYSNIAVPADEEREQLVCHSTCQYWTLP